MTVLDTDYLVALLRDNADAINQYMFDRNPREPLFAFGRCLAHFAIDPDEVPEGRDAVLSGRVPDLLNRHSDVDSCLITCPVLGGALHVLCLKFLQEVGELQD